MTGFVDGAYSRWHCMGVVTFDEDGWPETRCLKPAQLRGFRDMDVPLCDACFALIAQSEYTSG